MRILVLGMYMSILMSILDFRDGFTGGGGGRINILSICFKLNYCYLFKRFVVSDWVTANDETLSKTQPSASVDNTNFGIDNSSIHAKTKFKNCSILPKSHHGTTEI
jgi:hypothetical protein